MTSLDPEQVRAVVDELANTLQTAVVLAARVATSLRADVHEADQVYTAIARAAAALRRLTPTTGGQS